MSGALTDEEKRERKLLQRVVNRKIYKKEFRLYKKALSDRGLSVQDAIDTQFEVVYMKLWFSLNNQCHRGKAAVEP